MFWKIPLPCTIEQEFLIIILLSWLQQCFGTLSLFLEHFLIFSYYKSNKMIKLELRKRTLLFSKYSTSCICHCSYHPLTTSINNNINKHHTANRSSFKETWPIQHNNNIMPLAHGKYFNYYFANADYNLFNKIVWLSRHFMTDDRT
jgi:ABC-type oligopeptide transport system ATPase subunit